MVFMQLEVEFLDDGVMRSLAAFPKDIRASFERIVGFIQVNGSERMREPYVKYLEGPIWEMPMQGRDGIAAPLTLWRQIVALSSCMFLARRLNRPRDVKSKSP
jgi:hypothetical protein